MGAKVLFLYISLFVHGSGPLPGVNVYAEPEATGSIEMCREEAREMETLMSENMKSGGLFSGVSVTCVQVDRARAMQIHREMEQDMWKYGEE